MEIRRSFLSLAVLLAFPTVASATTIQVTGTVQTITNNTATLVLDGSVVIGTPYIATYTYDSNLLDQDPTPNDASYSPLTSFQITLGNYVISDAGVGGIRIINDGFPTLDVYQATTGVGILQSGSFGGTPDNISAFFVDLEDASGTALSSTALQLPELSKFGVALWVLNVRQGFGEPLPLLQIRGSVDSITEVAGPSVPEPTSASLLILGLLAMAGRRNRKGHVAMRLQ
jgi:hypothetical protein